LLEKTFCLNNLCDDLTKFIKLSKLNTMETDNCNLIILVINKNDK